MHFFEVTYNLNYGTSEYNGISNNEEKVFSCFPQEVNLGLEISVEKFIIKDPDPIVSLAAI